MKKLYTLSLFLLTSCSMTVDHKIHVGLDDECLLRFPACTSSGYTCEDASGVRDRGCEVACVAGRTLSCEADALTGEPAPVCRQLIGDEEPAVPVVCVSTGDSD